MVIRYVIEHDRDFAGHLFSVTRGSPWGCLVPVTGLQVVIKHLKHKWICVAVWHKTPQNVTFVPSRNYLLSVYCLLEHTCIWFTGISPFDRPQTGKSCITNKHLMPAVLETENKGMRQRKGNVRSKTITSTISFQYGWYIMQNIKLEWIYGDLSK